MKKSVILFFAVAVWFSSKAQYSDAALSYIDQYKDLAIEEMIRTGVPAAITLAQGILESQAGQSDLVLESNNHFGIKCKGEWTGNVVYHDDDVKNECFRRYNTAEESYRDHSDFLKSRSNYSSLFDLDVTDYKGWAYGLKKARYATNPVYAKSLITTIEKYNLEEFTDIALQRSNEINIAAAPGQTGKSLAFTNTNSLAVEDEQPEQYDAQAVEYPNGVFRINQANVLYARAGTSLFAIASQYSIPYKKLLQYNDLDNVDILKQSTLIYLEKKQKRGSRDYHIVSANENIFDIAQEEGVQLESLLVYNNLQKSTQPKAGDKILLRGGK
jgi:LysM repeat protein